MLNSLFSAEITDYVGLRYASVSVSAAKADEKVLNELDKFLTKAEVTDKQLTEEILTDFIATLTGKSKTAGRLPFPWNEIRHTLYNPASISLVFGSIETCKYRPAG